MTGPQPDRALSIALLCLGALALQPRLALGERALEQTETGAIVLDVFGGTRALYKIAVPPPSGDQPLAREIQAVATRDLELSSLFQVLDGRSFSHLDAGTDFDADAWRTVDAQGVIRGQVSREGGGARFQLGLFETASADGRAALQKSWSGPPDRLRRAVHSFVNELIRHFTGEPGVFGSRLLFARSLGRGNKQVFAVDMDGENLSRLTKRAEVNLLPAWGPGGSVYYTALLRGWAKLFRTGRQEPVLAEPGLNMGAAFSPTGGRMAVVLSRDGNSEIYVASADGSGLRNLTKHPSIDVSPTWSPDGSQLAFVSNRHGSPQIFVMGADGGGARRVTFAGSYNQTPAWCPRADTPRIAFMGDAGGAFDIFTIGVDGGSVTRLTQAQGTNTDPAWSPDGRLIAFWSSRGGIFLSTPEGLNQQLVLRGHAETLRWARRGWDQ